MNMRNSRRSFFWKMGAGVSAALVPASGAAATGHEQVDDPVLRAALLEEEKVIRDLHQDFEHALDQDLIVDVIAMFADAAEITFNGGVFRGREGVARLFRDRFPANRSGRRMEPAPGFELAAVERRDHVQVSADRLSARAVFPYSIQVGAPLESDNSLIGMARLHGEGVRTWWEGGAYHVAYRRDTTDSRWRITRLEYRTLTRADYRPGRTYAAPVSVARFSTRFPADRLGPDELVPSAEASSAVRSRKPA